MGELDGIWFRLGWKIQKFKKKYTHNDCFVELTQCWRYLSLFMCPSQNLLLNLGIYVTDYAVPAIVCDLFD